MKPYIANLIYGIVLIVLSLWGYFVSESPSYTAFIPVAFGVIFVVLTSPMKKGSRTIAHIISALTFLLLFGLIKPLTGAIGREDPGAIVRVLIMMAWGVFTFGVYVNSFIQARKNRT